MVFRRFIPFFGLVFYLGFFPASLSLAEQTAPPAVVGVVGAANGALNFTTLEPQLNWPILLRRTDNGTTASDATVDATNLISPSGRLQEVKLQRDGADFNGVVSVPAGQQVAVHLVGTIPEEGAYNGEIGIIIEGKRTPIAIKITRAVREVVVAGTTAGALQVTTPDPDLNWPIVIRRNDNAPGPRDVSIELGNLIAPSGQTTALGLRPGKPPVGTLITLQPVGHVDLNLVGKLVEEGIHTGEIGLVVDGKRLSTTLKITRTLKDSSVRIEDISQVHTTIERPGVTMHLRLQEADGLEATVDLPKFVKLDRKEGNASIQADYKGVKISLDDKPVGDTLVVAPRKTLDLALLIEGLNDPGNYAGTVRISSANRKPAEKAFELSLRRCIWIAGILIFIGVAASTAARLYMTVGRPTALAQAEALSVRDDLTRFQSNNADLTTDEQRILSELLSRLDKIRRSVADTLLGAPDMQVDEIRRKVDVFLRWIELRRRLDAVRPLDVGDAVRAKHKDVAQTLEKPGATKPDTDTATTNLQTYNTELKDAIQKRLTDSITALRTEIATLPPAQVIGLTQTDQDLAQALTRAAAGNFDAAAATLTAARHAYVEVAIRALQTSLDSTKPAPGFLSQSWISLTEDFKRRLNSILSELDPEQQIKDWNKIRTEWLRAIAEPLLSQINQLLDNLAKRPAPAPGTTPAPGSPDPAAAKLEFDKAKAALVSIDTLLASRKVQDAGNAYTEAVTAYRAGLTAMGGTVTLGISAAAATVAPGSGTDIPPSVLQGTWNAIAFALGAPTTVAEANNRVLLYEGILFGVLLLVAVAVGLKLLYFDNSSWGSLTDMTVAVLWGFGLHQVGGAAFQGVQSIAQQLPAR